ncbi:33K [Bearded dragon adenovirus 1]|uniref:33K n=1 Tax=Bearded dragon adenovirus 1 TaxID=2729647 RepID=A0A6N3IR72_9ADEN|nr:33K [Bearded dragon adenovirus 1]QJR83101.1 33K [Bearded dragon adenovirus 1]
MAAEKRYHPLLQNQTTDPELQELFEELRRSMGNSGGLPLSPIPSVDGESLRSEEEDEEEEVEEEEEEAEQTPPMATPPERSAEETEGKVNTRRSTAAAANKAPRKANRAAAATKKTKTPQQHQQEQAPKRSNFGVPSYQQHLAIKHEIGEVLEEIRLRSVSRPDFVPSIRNRTHPSITKRYLYEKDLRKLQQFLDDSKKLLSKYT